MILSKNIKDSLGMYNASKKKMRDESKRNIIKKGVKTKLPIGDSMDIGKPQLASIGKEINDMIS